MTGLRQTRAVVEADSKDKGQAVALEVRLTNKAGNSTAQLDPAVVEAEYTDVMKGAAPDVRFHGLRTWAAAKSKGSWPDTTAIWLETAAATRFNHDLLLLYRFYVGPPSVDKPALIPKSVLARVVERFEEEFWTLYKQKHANKAVACS